MNSDDSTVLVGHSKTLREQREHLWIAKLRRLPFFNQIVKKLIDSQGVATVARWCHELNPEGELHDKTLETWRKYLTALAMQVRCDLKSVKRVEVEPLAYQAAVKELKRQQEAAADVDPVPKAARPIWSAVKKAVRELEAETMLKYCFVIQQRRVQAMLELEKKTNLLMPEGYKELAVLRKIAAEVLKYEIGKQRLKGKTMPLVGPYPDGLSAHAGQTELSPLAQEAARFDPVDRNIMQEIVSKMIDMCEEEKASGRTQVGGLAPDAGGKVGAQAEVSESGVGSDV